MRPTLTPFAKLVYHKKYTEIYNKHLIFIILVEVVAEAHVYPADPIGV